jgi:transposase
MGQPLAITRMELSAAELRAHAARSRDGAVVRRLLALALVLEGHSRESAARLSGMSRQTLGDWVHRYNAEGAAGLASRSSPGRPPTLSAVQKVELKALVLAGPDPERHGVMRWRCCDLRAEIATRWSVAVCEQTVGRWLHQLGLTRVQPRPSHPRKAPEAEAAFKKTFPPW